MSSDQTSKGAVRIRAIAFIFLLMLPISALATRFGIWSFKIGLMIFVIAMFAGVVLQIISAIWLMRKPSTGTKSVLRFASLFALPPLILFAVTVKSVLAGYPAIHNISTDQVNPPQFTQGIIERGETSNPLEYSVELAKVQAAAYPDLAPLNSEKSVAQAFEKALAISEASGWKVYSQDPQKGIIEAVDTTFWFGFKDDIVIRIAANETGSTIDLRSVSRVGVSDMGVNTKRIRAFIANFKQ